MESQIDVENFFKQAAAIKQSRAKDYDNGSRSAYEIALGMFDEQNQYLVAIWPCVQKVSRLVTLAQQAQRGHFDNSAMTDTFMDLANYTAMAYLELCKQEDTTKPAESEEPQKFLLKPAEDTDKKINL